MSNVEWTSPGSHNDQLIRLERQCSSFKFPARKYSLQNKNLFSIKSWDIAYDLLCKGSIKLVSAYFN